MAEENRHIFNNLTQVEKIKPKIDNPIVVEDVTYNFSDLIENEWISHFPQYSHRMRSTFVKGAGIVDEHLANINQCLIQLEDELYRVYDKLSDDKKAEVTVFIKARQNEVNTFIQARKDEVASFISDRKTEVADFIKDRKNEVSTFISDKQNLVDEFVQKRKDEVSNFITDKQNIVDEFVKARKTEVADFIKSKTNEVSKYISQKEEQITKFIKDKDSEIKTRTDTLDSYTKDLEGKIDQFNHVIQGGEATEDKLGLIKLSTISEQVQVATFEDIERLFQTTTTEFTNKQMVDIAFYDESIFTDVSKFEEYFTSDKYKQHVLHYLLVNESAIKKIASNDSLLEILWKHKKIASSCSDVKINGFILQADDNAWVFYYNTVYFADLSKAPYVGGGEYNPKFAFIKAYPKIVLKKTNQNRYCGNFSYFSFD